MSLFKQVCIFEEVRLPDFKNDAMFSVLTGAIDRDIDRISFLERELLYYANICKQAKRRLGILKEEGVINIRVDYDRALAEV